MKKTLIVLTAIMLTACAATRDNVDETNISMTETLVITESETAVSEIISEVTDTITEEIYVKDDLNDRYITNNNEKIYTFEDSFPSYEHLITAKETAFTDDKMQESIKIDHEDGMITAETADGLRFVCGLHADFDNDSENESLIALALPARAMGGGSVIYVDGSESFKLYIDINSSFVLNSYTFGDKQCFSVTGTAGAGYYFTSIFTVEDDIPQEKLNYNTIEFENGTFKCIDKFDSGYTYYVLDEETGEFIQIEK